MRRCIAKPVNAWRRCCAGSHDGASLEPVLSVESMAEFVLAVGVGTTVERAAEPAALADDDLMVILPRGLGLPDVQRAARAVSAPTN